MPFALMDRYWDFFAYLSDNFEITYWLPGNHEYYHTEDLKKIGTLNEKIKSNVILINNTSVKYKDTQLIFSTLWSKISQYNHLKIQAGLNDFHMIRLNGHRLSIELYNQLHQESIKYIKETLKTAEEEKVLVFTHHVPTYINYPEHYLGNILNEAFATELADMINGSRIDYWIYGHHHMNIPNFKIGNTTLLTNQLGYLQRNDESGFQSDCFIKL